MKKEIEENDSVVWEQGAEEPRTVGKEAEEETPFGVGQFIKLVVFGLILVGAAYFLGNAMRFMFDQPFFVFSMNGDFWVQIALGGVALLVFLVVGGITMVAYSRSFLAFIPVWIVASLGFYVGIGEYGLAGLVVGAGFVLGLVVFYMFVKGDLKDSFSFSVRSAFRSMGMFLTIVFVALAAGYYMNVEDVLSGAELLPEEVMRPIYNAEKLILASQLGVPEDQVESKLELLAGAGEQISFLGMFDSDAELQSKGLYNWMHEKVSEVVAGAIPWVAGGMTILVFFALSIIIMPATMLSRVVIFVVMQALIVLGVFKKKTVMREAEVLEI